MLRTRLGHLARQQAGIRALIGKSQADGVPGLFLIEEEYRLAALETEEAFVGRLIQRIDGPATGWAGQWAAFHSTTTPPGEVR